MKRSDILTPREFYNNHTTRRVYQGQQVQYTRTTKLINGNDEIGLLYYSFFCVLLSLFLSLYFCLFSLVDVPRSWRVNEFLFYGGLERTPGTA